jgi:hypothetical protein
MHSRQTSGLRRWVQAWRAERLTRQPEDCDLGNRSATHTDDALCSTPSAAQRNPTRELPMCRMHPPVDVSPRSLPKHPFAKYFPYAAHAVE